MSEKRKETDNGEEEVESKRLKIEDQEEKRTEQPLEEAKKEESSDEDNGINELLKTESAEVLPEHGGHVEDKGVGITEYVSDHTGFKGILKQRYSDFMVWECKQNGDIVHLTDLEVPPHKPVAPADKPDTSVLLTLPKHTQSLLWRLTEDGGSIDRVKIPCRGKSREERKALHLAVKELHADVTSNWDARDSVLLVFKQSKPDGRDWPEGRPMFIHFVMYKENVDTMRAVTKLGHCLRMGPRCFSYAGVKDKRGSTCQMVSIRRVAPYRLKEASDKLNNIHIGNFTYEDRRLELGDLSGNRFAIVLRCLDSDESVVDTALTNVRDYGFINYFGLQRFGTTTIPTHHVGRALLKKQYKEAIQLILKPRDDDKIAMKEARDLYWKTHNAEATLKVLRKLRMGDTIEAELLTCLSRAKNHHDAFQRLPRNFKLIYMHAYQSYIWNATVSKRIAKHGLKVLEGDLVYESDEDVKPVQKGPKPTRKIRRVKEEEVDSIKITDVLVPLPGSDIEYPRNDTNTLMIELLQEDKLSITSFASAAKSAFLTGAYRKILVKPTDMAWSYSNYSDPTIPLILSDKDILDGVKLQPTEGHLKGVTIELTLPSCSYATMALREAMKVETSVHSMIQLQKEMPQSEGIQAEPEKSTTEQPMES